MLGSLIKNLLFPLECLICHQGGSCLCSSCFKKIKFSYPAWALDNLKTSALDKLFIAGDYEDGLLKELIKKYKYGFNADLAQVLGHWLTLFWGGQMLTASRPKNYLYPKNENCELQKTSSNDNKNTAAKKLLFGQKPNNNYFLNYQGNLWKNFYLIPIPLSSRRERWRGFNQTRLLAEILAANFDYPLLEGLARKHYQQPQSSLNELDRKNNISGAFVWTGKNLKNKKIILIDDVITTGATLNEAAKTLKQADATCVYGLALAKG